MKKIWLLVICLIVYGSLFPFNFTFLPPDPAELRHLFTFSIAHMGRGDLVANIILFIPYGILASEVIKMPRPWQSLCWVMGSALLLAQGVQVGQLFLPGRLASGTDTCLNMIGTLCGVLIARYLGAKSWQDQLNSLERITLPDILALSLIAVNFAPFIPAIDLQLVKDHVKSILDPSGFSIFWTFQVTVLWLVTFYWLVRGRQTVFRPRYFLLLVLACLAIRLFILGNFISINDCLGSLLAILVWHTAADKLRAPLLGLLLLLVALGIGLYPFEWRDQPGSFSWVPFSGALSSNMVINVQSMLKKCLLYGCVVYLLSESGIRLRISALYVAVVLFLSEQLQVYLISSTPEITDPLMALLSAWMLYEYSRISKPNTTHQLKSYHSPDDSHLTDSRLRKRRSSRRKHWVLSVAVLILTIPTEVWISTMEARQPAADNGVAGMVANSVTCDKPNRQIIFG